MASLVRRLATGAFQINRKALEPVFVVRSAIGVIVALLGGFLTGNPIVAVAAAIGAMSTGFGSLQGVYRTRAATMLLMGLSMALTTGIAFLVAHSAVLIVLAVVVFGFAYGLLAALGPGPNAIGVNAMVALIVFEHLPENWATGSACVLAMFLGGVVQTVLLIMLWPIQRYPQERHALAGAYRDLASFAESVSAKPSVPSSSSLRVVRTTLADPRPFGRRAAAISFQTLLDEAERIRATLALLVTSERDAFADARPIVSRALRAIADALENAREPEDAALYERLSAECANPTLRALYGQVRAAWRAARIPLRGFSIPRAVPRFGRFPHLEEPLMVLRSQLLWKSTFFRHALRLALVLGIAASIGEVFSLQRGYWVTLTAVLVLRPDFTTTFTRGLARIGGTIVGVIAATGLVLLVPDTPHVYLALAMFFAAIGYAAFQLNYALFSVTITAYVVLLLALLGIPEHDAVVNRLLATIAGGILAMLSYLIWPTWEATHVRAQLRALIDADLAHTRQLLAGLSGSEPRDAARLQAGRSAVWAARASAQESLERMLAEPSSTYDVQPDKALGIMAATQRLGLANTALSSLYFDKDFTPLPQLSGLIERLAAPFGQIGHLRDASAPLEAEIAAMQSPRAKALHAALDLTIESIDTLADIVEQR
jgi:uncharacterized membrane protein YccC